MHVQEAGSVAQGKRYAEPSVVLIDDDEALHDAFRSISCYRARVSGYMLSDVLWIISLSIGSFLRQDVSCAKSACLTCRASNCRQS